MREGFNELLQEYGEISKDADRRHFSVDQDPQLKHRLKKTRRAAGQEFATTPEVQAIIFDIQKRKQAVVAEFRRATRQLDSPENKPGPRDIPVTIDNGQYFAQNRQGQLKPISRGELMTDGEWGRSYFLDATIKKSTRVGYLKAESRRQIRELYNQQILWQEANSGLTHEFKRQAYERMKRDREADIVHPGEIAEKMVRNFLTKLTIDHEIDFEIIEADVFQDVDQKIDFIIRRKSHQRGVKVIADESDKTFGIQFTTTQNQDMLEHKRHQVDSAKHRLQQTPVDDIVLVSLPIKDFMTAYQNWQQKRAPGGPDKLWSDETKAHIFKELMTNVFSPEEIERSWSKIQA